MPCSAMRCGESVDCNRWVSHRPLSPAGEPPPGREPSQRSLPISARHHERRAGRAACLWWLFELPTACQPPRTRTPRVLPAPRDGAHEAKHATSRDETVVAIISGCPARRHWRPVVQRASAAGRGAAGGRRNVSAGPATNAQTAAPLHTILLMMQSECSLRVDSGAPRLRSFALRDSAPEYPPSGTGSRPRRPGKRPRGPGRGSPGTGSFQSPGAGTRLARRPRTRSRRPSAPAFLRRRASPRFLRPSSTHALMRSEAGRDRKRGASHGFWIRISRLAELVNVVLPREKRGAAEELGDDAREAPHVHFRVVGR